ncbi:MAG: site-2 protease family protein, partial [Gemmataceae bacterium]|nr:site-2 protease family protein [Gemmataceae bacterium]
MPAQRRWVPALLLAATIVTTLLAGVSFRNPEEVGRPGADLLRRPADLLAGWPYALTVLAILGAHEMGHYLACRAYGVRATWPHFIPLPMLGFGTLGAFIRIRSPIPSRRALFDIAVAGPLAGFALTVPALAYGIWSASPAPPPVQAEAFELGDSLLVQGLSWCRWGSGGQGDNLWVGRVFLAGWLGQLATCLNLFPVGQLDGGHLLYSLSARLHRRLSRA